MKTVRCFQYRAWASEGRGQGPLSPLYLENFRQKGCFLSFEWEKTNFTTFVPLLEKILEKIECSPGGRSSSDAHSTQCIWKRL